MSDTLKRHSELLKCVAEATLSEVDATTECNGWDVAVFDLRVPSDGSGAMAITRVRVGNRVERMNLKSTGDYVFPLLDLRNQLPGSGWFGLYLVVNNTGKVDVRYDYDCQCLDRILDDDRFYNEG